MQAVSADFGIKEALSQLGIKDVNNGEPITIQVTDGIISAEVKKTHHKDETVPFGGGDGNQKFIK